MAAFCPRSVALGGYVHCIHAAKASGARVVFVLTWAVAPRCIAKHDTYVGSILRKRNEDGCVAPIPMCAVGTERLGMGMFQKKPAGQFKT